MDSVLIQVSLPFTKVESPSDQLQKDSLGKREEGTLLSDLAIVGKLAGGESMAVATGM